MLSRLLLLLTAAGVCAAAYCLPQEKKAQEEARKKELEQLFATTIKQPKVPAGETDRQGSVEHTAATAAAGWAVTGRGG